MSWEPTDEQVRTLIARVANWVSDDEGVTIGEVRQTLIAAVGPEIESLQAELSLLRTQHDVLANAVADAQQRALIERERAAAHRDDLETRKTDPPPPPRREDA